MCESTAPCPECGCEERDRQGFLTCQCSPPLPPPGHPSIISSRPALGYPPDLAIPIILTTPELLLGTTGSLCWEPTCHLRYERGSHLLEQWWRRQDRPDIGEWRSVPHAT